MMKSPLAVAILTVLTLGIVPARAIPTTPPAKTPSATSGASLDLSPDSLFTRRGSHESTVPQAPGAQPYSAGEKAFTPWGSDTNTFKVLGRYADRSAGTEPTLPDDAAPSALSGSGNSPDGTDDPFLKDLRPPDTNTNAEAEALHRAIREAAAKAAATSSDQEVHGWQDALLCLAGIALVAVVLVARR